MRYLVLGASAAGIHGAATLRTLDPEAEIVLVSEDMEIYSRCIMHHYMEGIRTRERLSFIGERFIEENRIEWISGVKAVAVNSSYKLVVLSDGRELNYDKLLIATGAHAFIPPIKGIDQVDHVFGFRNFEDCEQIMAKCRQQQVKDIVVLGAGLVGLDVTCGMLDYDKSIALVDMAEHLLPLQLDDQAAQAYQAAFAKRGVIQHYGVSVKEIQKESGHLCGRVVLNNDMVLPCDLLIVTTGVRPNVDFLSGSQVVTDKYGLVIDAFGRTNVDDIFGAGDVTGRNPIWPVAVKEGIIAASNMAGQNREMKDFFASKATMNFLGIPTLSVGIHEVDDNSYCIEILEDDQGNYKKIIHKDGLIKGAILQGDLSYAGILTQLIRRKINIAKVKKPLFKIDYSDFFHVRKNFEFEYQEEL